MFVGSASVAFALGRNKLTEEAVYRVARHLSWLAAIGLICLGGVVAICDRHGPGGQEESGYGQ